jgi:predicted nicotinamide N-methyase
VSAEAKGGFWRQVRALREALVAPQGLRDTPIALHAAARDYTFAFTMPVEDDRLLDEWVATLASAAGDSAAQSGEATDRLAALHLPYWATPWPSGFALAEMVLVEREVVVGRRALELGCGLGATAVAALVAGADLAVCDVFDEALGFCRFNCLQNTGREPRVLAADWRTPDGRDRLGSEGPFDLLLAADVLYDADDVLPLLELVPRLLVQNGQLWLADPAREAAAAFVARAAELGWQCETDTVEREWPAGAGRAPIVVRRYRVGRGSAGRAGDPSLRSG